MPINDPSSTQSRARAPRAQVLANGQQIAGVERFEVTVNNHRSAATWSVTVASGADPKHTAAFWQPTADVSIEILVDADGDGTFTSLVKGRLDGTEISLEQSLVTLNGRDRVADLIETKTFKNYRNQKSSDVAAAIASGHGLTADIDPTQALVGRYYEVDHDRIQQDQFARAQTEWDLLLYLAQDEGFDCWITDDTLHFKKPIELSTDPWIVAVNLASGYQSNVTELRLSRHNFLDRSVQVVIKSWNTRQAKGFQVTAPTSASKASASGGKSQRYVLIRANLTQDQAQQAANNLYLDILKHSRVISFTAPADIRLTIRTPLALQGSGLDYDQRYFVNEIKWTWGMTEGFKMDVTGKNMTPAAQALVG
jgi:phage protein D